MASSVKLFQSIRTRRSAFALSSSLSSSMSLRGMASRTWTVSATTTTSPHAAASLCAADVQLKRSRMDHDETAISRFLNENEEVRFAWMYSHALADSPDHRFMDVMLDDRMRQQLDFSLDQLRPRSVRDKAQQQQQSTTGTVQAKSDHVAVATTVRPIPVEKPDMLPLPRTLQDALRPTRRAIVVTTAKAPFVVEDVNEAWESLCGYSYVEAKGKTLGSLLKGPETNSLAATSLIVQLMRGEEAGTTLINYTKEGRRFCNRIRVGPLINEDGAITHFIGILQEVQQSM